MRSLVRIAAIAFAALIVSAAAKPTYIPLGKYGEGVVNPANSGLKFRRFDSYDSAHFDGQVLLEGVFIIDCADCEPGIKGTRLHLSIVPDLWIAARLPRWKKHDNDIAVDISGADSLLRTIVSPAKRSLLLSGKLDEIRGRTAIIVDRYTASLDCDSADYSAHFLAVAKRAKYAGIKTDGNYGCGFA
jgi:hypothetical protein